MNASGSTFLATRLVRDKPRVGQPSGDFLLLVINYIDTLLIKEKADRYMRESFQN